MPTGCSNAYKPTTRRTGTSAVLITSPAQDLAIHTEGASVRSTASNLTELCIRTVALVILVATPTFNLSIGFDCTAVTFTGSHTDEVALGRTGLAMIIGSPARHLSRLAKSTGVPSTRGNDIPEALLHLGIASKGYSRKDDSAKARAHCDMANAEICREI